VSTPAAPPIPTNWTASCVACACCICAPPPPGARHRQSPALGPGRGPARAAGRGGHRPRRRHPPDGSQGRQLPHRQDVGELAAGGVLHPQATQQALVTLEWIGRTENLAVAGPSGTGKSHFVQALAHAAIQQDLRVAWSTLESRTATISKAKVDATVARTLARICRCDLIVVDDIGMLPAGQEAAEAFYRVIDAAYQRRSLAVTSNIHPGGSTPSCPRHWPRRRWTGCCTTPTWSSPRVTATGSPRPWPARGGASDRTSPQT
jgi:IstB-like ATP binding protein